MSFDTYAGEVEAVRDVSFTLERGEVLAIVGESGSGKSVTAQALMGLTPIPPGEIKGGGQLDGIDLLAATKRSCRAIRGKEISMIFQDPMTALNPSMTVGAQIREVLLQHTKLSRAPRRERGQSSSCVWSEFPSRRDASASTRINSRAACASAS